MALLAVASMLPAFCHHAYGTYAGDPHRPQDGASSALTVAIGAVLLPVIGIWLLHEATGIPVRSVASEQHTSVDGP